MSGTTITLLILGAIVLWVIWTYNRFIKRKNIVQEAWSGIDVQLKRRYNLIPNLVETVKGYAKHESETLSKLTAQRTGGGDVAERGKQEMEISKAIQNLLAVAEAYPDLKANENFLSLQNELVETENYLQFVRRYYNGSVRDYNTMTETVPSNIIAGMFNFEAKDFFQKSSDEAANVPLAKFGTVE